MTKEEIWQTKKQYKGAFNPVSVEELWGVFISVATVITCGCACVAVPVWLRLCGCACVTRRKQWMRKTRDFKTLMTSCNWQKKKYSRKKKTSKQSELRRDNWQIINKPFLRKWHKHILLIGLRRKRVDKSFAICVEIWNHIVQRKRDRLFGPNKMFVLTPCTVPWQIHGFALTFICWTILACSWTIWRFELCARYIRLSVEQSKRFLLECPCWRTSAHARWQRWPT